VEVVQLLFFTSKSNLEKNSKITEPKHASHSQTKTQTTQFSALVYIFKNLSKHRARTLITIIGIAIPIAFFILFAAMGDGLDQYIDDQADELHKKQYEEMTGIVNSWTGVLMMVITIIIITNISNIMLMSTSERKFEFGVLKAIGLRNDEIIYLVMMEAFILSGLALMIGIIIGTWSAVLFDYMFYQTAGSDFFFAPTHVSLEIIIGIAILTLVLGTGMAVYPAIESSKLNTTEILRCE
jgi:ABC-type antimicrobial peptide transport system permease subunit